MRLPKDIAMILLAIYLIIVGLEGPGLGFCLLSLLAALCALAAGILILINRQALLVCAAPGSGGRRLFSITSFLFRKTRIVDLSHPEGIEK